MTNALKAFFLLEPVLSFCILIALINLMTKRQSCFICTSQGGVMAELSQPNAMGTDARQYHDKPAIKHT